MLKKRKALMYAATLTFIIAIIYILIYKGKMYTFRGTDKEFSPISSLLKDTSKAVEENVQKGTNVIKSKQE